MNTIILFDFHEILYYFIIFFSLFYIFHIIKVSNDLSRMIKFFHLNKYIFFNKIKYMHLSYMLCV